MNIKDTVQWLGKAYSRLVTEKWFFSNVLGRNTTWMGVYVCFHINSYCLLLVFPPDSYGCFYHVLFSSAPIRFPAVRVRQIHRLFHVLCCSSGLAWWLFTLKQANYNFKSYLLYHWKWMEFKSPESLNTLNACCRGVSSWLCLQLWLTR